MKSLRFIYVLALGLFTNSLFAQSKSDSILVGGNCNMCKKRIEAAATVPGVAKANWDVNSKMLTISFKSKKTGLDEIQKQVALAGHDTPKFKALSSDYQKLPKCCQYERTGSKDGASGDISKQHN